MSSLKISILLSFIVFFSACSVKERIVTQEVLIPIKCEKDIPNRPKPSGEYGNDVITILAYTEKLEEVVKDCVEPR